MVRVPYVESLIYASLQVLCVITDICVITGTGGLRKHGLGQGKPPCPGSHTRPAAPAVTLTATSGIPITSHTSTAASTTTSWDIIHYVQRQAQTVQAIQRRNLLTRGGLVVGGECAIDGSQLRLRGAAWWTLGWILSACRLLDRQRLSNGCRRGAPLAYFPTSSLTSCPNLNALWAGHAS